MEIETRTPDEMLDGAMKRIISIAEAVIKAFPRLVYNTEDVYEFSFDKGVIYKYSGPLDTYKGIIFEKDFFHIFQRQSDGQMMVATKYSESPIKV